MKTEQKMLDEPKEQVIDRQFKHNCDYGFKQRNVNYFIRLAFESGFENGMNYQKNSTTAPKTDLVSKTEIIKKLAELLMHYKQYGDRVELLTVGGCITKIKEI